MLSRPLVTVLLVASADALRVDTISRRALLGKATAGVLAAGPLAAFAAEAKADLEQASDGEVYERAAQGKLGVARVITRAEEGTLIDHLGPDPLRDEFDRDEALARLTADPERPIGLALLDQRVIAGLGNDYRNETLFLRGVLPETPVGETDAAAALDLAVRLIRANRDRNERTTTGDTRRDKRLWVAHRDRKPCRRCGTPIRRGLLGEDALSERILRSVRVRRETSL